MDFASAPTSDDVSSAAFRVSIARERDETTTYYDPGFFYDPESFSCCDLQCGTYNTANTDCSHEEFFCMSCRRTGPAGSTSIAYTELSGERLTLHLSQPLSDAACGFLAASSTLFFVHYTGSEPLRVDGSDVEAFGADWVDVETSLYDADSFQLTREGSFPMIPKELGVSSCHN